MNGPDSGLMLAADQLRIEVELVDTVVRDLFGVGLTLQDALAHVRGPGEQPLVAAIDGIDGIIRRIRDVALELSRTRPDSWCATGESEQTGRAGASSW